MSEPANSSALTLPPNAWGERGIRAVVPVLQRLVAVLLVLQGVMMLIAQPMMAHTPGFDRIKVPYPWPMVPQNLLLIALGACVWRGKRGQVRRCLALTMFAMAATAVGWYFESASVFSKAHWFSIASVGVWTVVGLGVWRGSEWGRRGCMLVGLALYGWLLVGQVQAMELSSVRDSFPVLFYVSTAFTLAVAVLPFVALAIYGVLPSTRREFAAVRAARHGTPLPN